MSCSFDLLGPNQDKQKSETVYVNKTGSHVTHHIEYITSRQATMDPIFDYDITTQVTNEQLFPVVTKLPAWNELLEKKMMKQLRYLYAYFPPHLWIYTITCIKLNTTSK